MFDWLRNLTKNITAAPLTITGSGPIAAYVERLIYTHTLHITGTADVDGRPGSVAKFHIQIADPTALKELSALLANAVQRLDPPYYTAEDLLPLWEDEHEDVVEDVKDIFGTDADMWLDEYNIRLGGKTPREVIADGKGHWVREILRSIKVGAFS